MNEDIEEQGTEDEDNQDSKPTPTPPTDGKRYAGSDEEYHQLTIEQQGIVQPFVFTRLGGKAAQNADLELDEQVYGRMQGLLSKNPNMHALLFDVAFARNRAILLPAFYLSKLCATPKGYDFLALDPDVFNAIWAKVEDWYFRTYNPANRPPTPTAQG